MWTQLAGMGLSMAQSYLANKSQNDQIDAQNDLNMEAYYQNMAYVSEMLSTADYRAERAYDEANAAAVRTKMNAVRAGKAARGTARVQAAAMGIEGRRASRDITKDISAAEGEAISDANINLQTELSNITEHFNDTARQAITNLNNARPTLDSGMSTSAMLLSSVQAGSNYFSGLSSESKAEFGSLFSSNTGSNGSNLTGAGNSYASAFSDYA